jgi:hypothetical protein
MNPPNHRLHPLLVLAAIAFALVAGLGELASLQRWRLKEWLAR